MMTIKTLLLSTTLLLVMFLSPVNAKEAPIILIDMEVYNLSSTQLGNNVAKKNKDESQPMMQAAVLESAPRLMIQLGKEAEIEIGTQDSDGKDQDMFRVLITSHALDNTYDIDIELTNKGAERVTSIADLAFNNTFALTTSINDITKLVKITATQHKNLAEAQAARDKK